VSKRSARKRYLRRVMGLSVAAQIPVDLMLWRVLVFLGVPDSGPLTLLLVLYLNLGVLIYVRGAMPEQRLSSWKRLGLVLPAFIHFIAAFIALLPATLLLLAYGLSAVWMWGDGQEAARVLWLGQLDGFSAVTVAVALLLSTYGLVIRRRWVQLTRHRVGVAGLAPGLDGYKIVQLSDLHIGNFSSEGQRRGWVRDTNAQQADLICITGDLINSGDQFFPELFQLVKALRAKDGVIVILGNHDHWCDVQKLVAGLHRAGAQVLRNSGVFVGRGGDLLYVGGLEDLWSGNTDLSRTLNVCPRGTPMVLLAHDPSDFPAAAARGVALTLAGHTHGGQLAIPFRPQLNLSARVYTFSSGVYHLNEAMLYVHRGLGTTGPPFRLGSAPEIAVFTLLTPPVVGRGDSEPDDTECPLHESSSRVGM